MNRAPLGRAVSPLTAAKAVPMPAVGMRARHER